MIIIILFILTFSFNCCTDQPGCFLKKLFNFNAPKQGFYNISVTNQSYLYNVKAYGDFNSDLASDYVTLSSDNSVSVYLWNKQISLFVASSNNPAPKDCLVQTIYLYDINDDGLLDFVIWGNFQSGGNCLIPFQQIQGNSISFQQKNQLLSELTSNPIYFSHKYPILIKGFLIYLNGTRSILQYDPLSSSYKNLDWSLCFPNSSIVLDPFRKPHWNTFLDITGDCLPDVILFNQNGTIEFWINKGKMFQLIILPIEKMSSIVSLSFSDINFDGGIDLVLVFSSNIKFYLNNKPALSSNDFCCDNCNMIPFNIDNFQIFEIDPSYEIPQQNIHFGDINIDGYPDILLLRKSITTGIIRPYIYLNNQIDQTFTSPSQYNDIFDAVLRNQEIVSVSFFDILQNGIVDTFVSVKSQNYYGLYVFYNNYLYQNNFFIKGYAVIGPNTDRGSPLNAATFYWVNSINGVYRVSTQSQIFQTAYDSLQMPYIINGLGRANNYVESFTVSNEGIRNSWSPIIPNSQLAIYLTDSSPKDWAIRIFVLPTQSLVYVVIVSIVILSILGGALLIFKYRKYKKDHNNESRMIDVI